MSAGSFKAPAISVSQLSPTKELQSGLTVVPELLPLVPSGAQLARPFATEAGHGGGATMVPVAQPTVHISTATGGMYLPPPPPPVRSLEDMEAEQAEKAKQGVRGAYGLLAGARLHREGFVANSDNTKVSEEPRNLSMPSPLSPLRHSKCSVWRTWSLTVFSNGICSWGAATCARQR